LDYGPWIISRGATQAQPGDGSGSEGSIRRSHSREFAPMQMKIFASFYKKKVFLFFFT
jgi:hypothetical protein